MQIHSITAQCCKYYLCILACCNRRGDMDSPVSCQDTRLIIMPGRAAAVFPARLTRTRPRACRCFFTHSFNPPHWNNYSTATTCQGNHQGADGHSDRREDAGDCDTVLPKQGANAFGERCVFVENHVDSFSDLVDLGTQGLHIRRGCLQAGG
jgi:hypothetical protein